MPLMDHFHPPLSEQRPWEMLHNGWANAMAVWLNQKVLPAGYFAGALSSVGRVEVDVPTLEGGEHGAAA